MFFLVFLTAVMASQSPVIPYRLGNGMDATVQGSFTNIPGASGIVPIHLSFDPEVDVRMRTTDGLGFVDEIAGSVILSSDSGDNVQIILDNILVEGAGEGLYEQSNLAIGPYSAILREYGQIDVVPTSDRGGVARFNSTDSPLACIPNTTTSIPWLASAYLSVLHGHFHLINTNMTTTILSETPRDPQDRISAIRLTQGDLLIPDNMNLYIRELIPELSRDSLFPNCEQVRATLPIIGIVFEPLNHMIVYYPEDYTVAEENSTSCRLRVNDRETVYGNIVFASHDPFSINPFLLKGVAVRVNQTAVTFCDANSL